jgi:tRNA1(Val) A37 N6-methylase TrmN6
MPTEISAERCRASAGITEDAALGGKLILRQPRRGHRFGHDAILLAAAVSAQAAEHAIELGAGIGAAGLALARRIEGLSVTLVEIDPALVTLARENVQRNGLAGCVRAVCLDVAAEAAAFAAAGLEPEAAAHVLMNPPFNAAHNPSPERGRHLARTATKDTLTQWLRAAARLLKPAGEVTLIWRADGLDEVLRALGDGFGASMLLPIHPKPGEPAIRVILRATKDRNGPLTLLPGLVLADRDGRPSAQAEAVLRRGVALPFPAR